MRHQRGAHPGPCEALPGPLRSFVPAVPLPLSQVPFPRLSAGAAQPAYPRPCEQSAQGQPVLGAAQEGLQGRRRQMSLGLSALRTGFTHRGVGCIPQRPLWPRGRATVRLGLFGKADAASLEGCALSPGLQSPRPA